MIRYILRAKISKKVYDTLSLRKKREKIKEKARRPREGTLISVHIPRPSSRSGWGSVRNFRPTPTPRMLGTVQPTAGVAAGDARHPLPVVRRLSHARPGRRSAARPVRGAELPLAADGASVECPPDTGGTGDPPRSGRADRPPHYRSQAPGDRPKGRSRDPAAATLPHFLEKDLELSLALLIFAVWWQ